jgi:hypothetical protein
MLDFFYASKIYAVGSGGDGGSLGRGNLLAVIFESSPARLLFSQGF